MGHKQHPQAELVLQLPQQGQDLGLHFRIKHADAFIAEQHLGFEDQGPGDGHPLLLAARELAGQSLFKGFWRLQAHGTQPVAGPFAGLAAARQAMDQQGVGNGIAHAHLGVEAGQGVLKHHLDPASFPAEGGPFEAA